MTAAPTATTSAGASHRPIAGNKVLEGVGESMPGQDIMNLAQAKRSYRARANLPRRARQRACRGEVAVATPRRAGMSRAPRQVAKAGGGYFVVTLIATWASRILAPFF